MTLHEAMIQVLREGGTPRSTDDLAAAINRDKLYARRDGTPLEGSQVGRRARKRPLLFSISGSVVALVASEAGTETTSAGAGLLADESFRSASEIDSLVEAEFGIYALRVRAGRRLPEPFGTIADERGTPLIYIGKAERQTLRKRLLGNELRAQGHGTFFRSIGAVLGYRPAAGSLSGKANQTNFRFSPADRDSIVEWINDNLEVSWLVMDGGIPAAEAALIAQHTPLLNVKGNPSRLPELVTLRQRCRDIATEEH